MSRRSQSGDDKDGISRPCDCTTRLLQPLRLSASGRAVSARTTMVPSSALSAPARSPSRRTTGLDRRRAIRLDQFAQLREIVERHHGEHVVISDFGAAEFSANQTRSTARCQQKLCLAALNCPGQVGPSGPTSRDDRGRWFGPRRRPRVHLRTVRSRWRRSPTYWGWSIFRLLPEPRR